MKGIRGFSLAAWVLIALAYLGFFLTDLQLDYAQLLAPCEGLDCNYLAISQAEFDVLAAWGWPPQAYSIILNGATLLSVLACWLLGGLILWRQGNTRIGWTVSLTLAVIPITMISDADNVIAHYPTLAVPVTALSNIGMIVFLGFVYLFPNGRFYPRWAYAPFIITAFLFGTSEAAFENFVTLPLWIEQLGSLFLPSAVLVATVLAAGVFQIIRYRRESTPIERQQTKWSLMGIVLLLLGVPVWVTFFGGLVDIPSGLPRLLVSLGGWLIIMLLIISLPVTMAIAIMRYRLWGIDLVIRRTLQYTLLTALLALVYFGLILFLQTLFGQVISEQSPIIIVLSTLAIAALFSPLRRRVQEVIDRRFFRQKYDAQQVLAAFARTARDETDLDELLAELQRVVEDTLQPEGVNVWLKREKN